MSLLRIYSMMAFFLFILLSNVNATEQPKESSVPMQQEREDRVEFIIPLHEHTANCSNTTAEPVQIICILDRSGSMLHLTSDTIGGYNSFIDKQKKESGKAEVTTVLFDNQYELLLEAMPLEAVPVMTSKEYLDAVGKTILATLERMNADGICPEKRRVIILIMTDGLENASVEYNRYCVKNLIEDTTNKYKWQYIFLGANMDSISEAQKLGIDSTHAADFKATGAGVKKSFDYMGAAVASMRVTGEVGDSWKD